MFVLSPTIGIFLYVAQAVECVLAVALDKNCWFESHYRHISVRSPGSRMCASSSLRKQTVGLSPTIGVFLYVAQAVECVPAVAFRKNYVGLSPTIGIFLYVA